MKIIRYDSVDSTNKIAVHLTEQGEREGTAVVADTQRKGRGRMGRAWISCPGNLFVSYIINGKTVKENPELSFLVGITVAESIEKLVPQTKCFCKWPNDIMLNDCKICGILIEAAAGGCVVAGIGVNLQSHPENVSYPTSSVLESTGRRIEPDEMCKCLSETLLTNLDIWRRRGFAAIRDKWLSYAYRLKETVTVKQFEKTYTGIFQTISESGELIIENTENHQKTKISVGDVIYEK